MLLLIQLSVKISFVCRSNLMNENLGHLWLPLRAKNLWAQKIFIKLLIFNFLKKESES